MRHFGHLEPLLWIPVLACAALLLTARAPFGARRVFLIFVLTHFSYMIAAALNLQILYRYTATTLYPLVGASVFILLVSIELEFARDAVRTKNGELS